MDLKVVALSVLVLFLCCDVSGYRLQKREAPEAQEKSTFVQFQETAQGYWDQFTNKARETGQKVKDVVTTYATIFWDQTQAWWNEH
ncbi:UNVERIFIED_CONTAM: hypothetical protein K2H54_032742 [Gekko kuhli]